MAQNQSLNDLRVRTGFKQYASGSHAPKSLTTLEWCCYLQKQCYDPECGQKRKCESLSATTQSLKAEGYTFTRLCRNSLQQRHRVVASSMKNSEACVQWRQDCICSPSPPTCRCKLSGFVFCLLILFVLYHLSVVLQQEGSQKGFYFLLTIHFMIMGLPEIGKDLLKSNAAELSLLFHATDSKCLQVIVVYSNLPTHYDSGLHFL